MSYPTARRWLMTGTLIAAAGGCLALASAMEPPAEYTPGQASLLLTANINPTEVLSAADMARMMAAKAGGGDDDKKDKKDKKDFPDFSEVSKDFTKVVSSADGKSYYTIWKRDKDGQMLAELPRGYLSHKQFIATTIGGGDIYAGLQVGDIYCYWKRFDKRLALMAPNVGIRSTGDPETNSSVKRLFTDRVILDIPIVCMGPGGQPVIDMDALLLGHASTFFGGQARGMNTRLAKITKAKAFPLNVELAWEVPVAGGQLRTLHYSISQIKGDPSYKPRIADERIGYFTTVHRDLGEIESDKMWVRYINRWNLQKRDPKLKMSPPKEPIVFYIDHATPVRYRRWVKRGIEYWNEAYRQIGIDGAIEVRFQDKQTGAHMEKDPEDVRYNFIRWLANGQGTAIGPSRVNPMTGQILDADIVLTDGFIRGFLGTYDRVLPELAMENFTPETVAWLERNPRWDPRVRMVSPLERDRILTERAMRGPTAMGGHAAGMIDSTVIGDNEYDGLGDRISQINGLCMAAHGKAMQMATLRMHLDLMAELEAERSARPDDDQDEDKDEGSEIPEAVLAMIRAQLEQNPDLIDRVPEAIRARLAMGDEPEDDADDEDADDDEGDDEDDEDEGDDETKGDVLDGMPEEYVGPLLADLVAHEVGHTLGLRHNFKGSSIHTLDEINSPELKGVKAWGGSVMDYNGMNIRMETGSEQGDFSMIDLGPYDMWAIEYGYTFKDPKKVLARVAEDELPYATDENTWGPDPLAQRWDMGADPLEYAQEKIRLAQWHRERLIEKWVKDGDSWSKARRGYDMTLWQQTGAMSMMSRWIGGSYVHRDKKGDPNGRAPVEPVEVEKQRAALNFIIDNSFYDEAYGLDGDLLRYMSVDKWWDEGGMRQIFQDPTWPVHDRIMGIQAMALTMILNPTTLKRVFNNEFVIDAGEDALTLPELMDTVASAAWSELDSSPEHKYTAREPMISSLRRNLQREHLERMIDLSFQGDSGGATFKPVASLATAKLRELSSKIQGVLDGRGKSRLDAYTLAHLTEAKIRIDKALDAQYIYNTGDFGGRGGGFGGFFGTNGR